MGTAPGNPVAVLSRALDQVGDLLDRVRAEDLDRPTPCHDWKVSRLVDHVVADPTLFVEMMRGGQPDWSAEPEHVGGDWGDAFRSAADDLRRAWDGQDEPATAGADWQTAEFAVHAWDLARSLGVPTDELDHEAAARGLEFMRANLTVDNRGAAFAAERTAPPDAPVPDRLAAFAGREVGPPPS